MAADLVGVCGCRWMFVAADLVGVVAAVVVCGCRWVFVAADRSCLWRL